MRYLDLTFPTPEENLACDEVLLDACENDGGEEILRVWEAPRPFVVLGCASRLRDEAHADWCKRSGIPLLRRASGGCAVVQGDGCLSFALILRIPEDGPLTSIRGTCASIVARHAESMRDLFGDETRAAGLGDLALGDLKISGTAQRRRRRFMLVHGTFLLDFDLPLVGRSLAFPPRQPDYRRDRPHGEFLTNARASNEAVKAALRQTWAATETLADLPFEQINDLARTRHAASSWIGRF